MVNNLKLLVAVLGMVFVMPMLVSIGSPESVLANTVFAAEKKRA